MVRFLHPPPTQEKNMRHQEPLPWYTYSSIDFLEDLLQPQWKVFEYGTGGSTLFYADRCAEVHTIEHDSSWWKQITEKNNKADIQLIARDAPLIEGAEVIDKEFDSMNFHLPKRDNESADHYDGLYIDPWRGYASQIYKYGPKYFDFVACDAMARTLSLFYASKLVKDNGYILLDNADRWQYNALQKYLIDSGFGRIEFWGKGPKIENYWCTSVFSKNFKNKSMRIEKPLDSGDIYNAGR